MNLQVLFNSESNAEGYSTGWGLSFLIDGKILFDTGEDDKFLIHNINQMNIDIARIEAVIISHDHWDHTGGVWEILRRSRRLRLYGCPGFGSAFKKRVSEFPVEYFEVDNFMLIAPGIYSTGEIIGEYKGKNISEQALIVKTEKGLSVVTGCSHPGIIRILEKVKSQLNVQGVYSVLGGFHLKDCSPKDVEGIVRRFQELNVKRAGPTHCSGPDTERLFREKYGDNFIEAQVGQTIEL